MVTDNTLSRVKKIKELNYMTNFSIRMNKSENP